MLEKFIMSFLICILKNVIRMMQSRRMRWVGHVVCIGRSRYRKVWWESQKERDH
jgi:hypothetical protein